MPYSRCAGLELPLGFNVAAYDSVSERVPKFADPNVTAMKNAWHVYASAWNGVAFRLRAAMDYHQEFSQSIAKTSAPAGEERLIQERALFGFAASALSCVECFFMASYGVGVILVPHSFPLLERRDLFKYPCSVAVAFRDGLPDVSFSRKLGEIARSPQYRVLQDLRDFLAHRGMLPRMHYVSIGSVGDVPSAIPEDPKALAKDFSYTANLGRDTTAAHYRWLIETLNELVQEFDDWLLGTAKGDGEVKV